MRNQTKPNHETANAKVNNNQPAQVHQNEAMSKRDGIMLNHSSSKAKPFWSKPLNM